MFKHAGQEMPCLIGMEGVHASIVLSRGVAGVREEVLEEVPIHVCGIGLHPHVDGEWAHGGCHTTCIFSRLGPYTAVPYVVNIS